MGGSPSTARSPSSAGGSKSESDLVAVDGAPVGHPSGPRVLPAEQADRRRDDGGRPRGPPDRARARSSRAPGVLRRPARPARPRACWCSPTTASSPSCSPTRASASRRSTWPRSTGVPGPAAIRAPARGSRARRRRDDGSGPGGGRLARRAPPRDPRRAEPPGAPDVRGRRPSRRPPRADPDRAGHRPVAPPRQRGGRSSSPKCARSPQAALRPPSSR